MPGSNILQAYRRRQTPPGHPASTVIGRSREFHAQLAGCGWSIHAQGAPRYGDLGDDAGGLSAKIMRYRPGNGLTGAIGEATEVRPGMRGAVFPIFFRWHHIQHQALRSCSRIDTPIKMKGFSKRERLTKRQELGIVVIHHDGRQVDTGLIPGQIDIAKDHIWRWRSQTWHQGPCLRPFNEGTVVGINIRLGYLERRARLQRQRYGPGLLMQTRQTWINPSKGFGQFLVWTVIQVHQAKVVILMIIRTASQGMVVILEPVQSQE